MNASALARIAASLGFDWAAAGVFFSVAALATGLVWDPSSFAGFCSAPDTQLTNMTAAVARTSGEHSDKYLARFKACLGMMRFSKAVE
jgi:hypothetical protein